MARTFIAGIGPTFIANEATLDQAGTGDPDDYSCPATTVGNSLTPSVTNARWLKVTKGGDIDYNIVKPESIDTPTIAWLCIADVVAEGMLGNNDFAEHVQIVTTRDTGGVNFLNIRVVSSANGGPLFVRIQSDAEGSIVTSSTFVAGSQQVSIKVEMDGTNLTLWMDEVLQGSGAYTGIINNRRIRSNPSGWNDASDICYYSMITMWGGDSTADRPAAKAEVDYMLPNGDAAEQDYGDNINCDSGSTSGEWQDVLPSALDLDSTTFICESGGDNGEQGMTMDTPSLATASIDGICVRWCSSVNLSNKSAPMFTTIRNGGDETEKTNTSPQRTAYRGKVLTFPDPPGGVSTWDAIIAGLEIVVRTTDVAGANDRHAFLIVEAFGSLDERRSLPHRTHAARINHLVVR